MQIFEILLIVFLLMIFLAKKIIIKNQWKKIVLSLLFLTSICHFFIDGMRWQMLPVYFTALISVVYLSQKNLKKWVQFILIFFGVLGLIIGGLLGVLLPVFELPIPTGKYTIGTKKIYLEDNSRLESITADTTDNRRITLKMYYPSDSKLENPEKYLENGIATAFANNKGIPTFAFSHFDLILTHTESDLSFAEGNFPLIILSHGYLWNVELYSSFVEELVSQGFVVAGVQHTYEAPIVHWESEKLYPIQSYFEATNKRMDYDKFGQIEAKFKAEKEPNKRLELMQEMMRILPYNESVERWQKDISYAIDELIKLNQNNKSDWFNKFDTNKIGVIGHSFGGAAAAEVTALDTRIQAGVNLDGAQWGKLIDTTLNKPFMAMYADRNYEEFFSPNFFIFSQTAKSDFYEVIIKNTGHANYGDLGFWTPLHQFTETGNINPNKMSQYTSTLLLTFFNKYLNDEEVELEEILLPKEEILIEKLN